MGDGLTSKIEALISSISGKRERGYYLLNAMKIILIRRVFKEKCCKKE